MKRRHLLIAPVLVLGGCLQGRIDDAQERVTQAQQQVDALRDRKVAPLRRDVEALRRKVQEAVERRVAAERETSLAQQRMVALWAADDTKLGSLLEKAGVNADASKIAREAQKTLAPAVVAKHLEAALASKDAKVSAGKLLHGWEARAGLATDDPGVSEPLACERPALKVQCAESKDKAHTLCADGASGAVWLVGVQGGFLRSWMLPREDAEVRLREVVSPTLAVLEGEGEARTDDEDRVTRRWVDVVQLGKGAAVRKARWAVEGTTVAAVDLDGDGGKEVVAQTLKGVKAFRAEAGGVVRVMTADEVCASVARMKDAPGSLRKACAGSA